MARSEVVLEISSAWPDATVRAELNKEDRSAFVASLINMLSAMQQGALDGKIVAKLGATAASGTVTATYGSVADGDTVTVGSKTFTAKDEVAEVKTLTCDTVANSTNGDYVIIQDATGNDWAVALDKTGGGAEPTGANWVAVPAARKAQADISGDTTAANVAATVEAAFNGLTGFGDVFTTDDTAADGTIEFTSDVVGNLPAGETYDDDDSGAGSQSWATDTPGLAKADMTALQFAKQVDATTTVTNLKEKIDADAVLSEIVSTSVASGVLTVTALTEGEVGEQIALAETGNGFAVSAAYLASGGDGTERTHGYGLA